MSEPQHEQPVQPLIEHLLELRRRMMWIVIGIVVCFLGMMPFAQAALYLVAEAIDGPILPKDTSMIATDVIAPFFCAGQGYFDGGVSAVVAAYAVSSLGVCRSCLIPKRKTLDYAAGVVQRNAFLRWYGVCLFSGVSRYFQIFGRCNPCRRQYGDRYRQIPVLYLGMFVAFGTTFEVPVVVVLLAKMGIVSTAQLKNARPYVIVGAVYRGRNHHAA